MYLVQTAAFAAKRLARRGVALHSTAAYDALTKELREVARLEEVSGILSYDEQCFMSEGSAASRAAQKEALAGVIHEKRTSTRMAEVIDAARGLTLADAREMDFVDGDRMALIGMSHGGWSIMDLLALNTAGRLPFNLRGMTNADVSEALSGVRALVLVYPWCGLANRARQTSMKPCTSENSLAVWK